MKLFLKSAMVVLSAALLSATASAACGGGGYKSSQSTTQPEIRQQRTVAATEVRQERAAPTTEYRQVDRNEVVPAFDSQFLRVQGRLNLSHDQYTRAMKVSRDVRSKSEDRSQRNFDAKHELDIKLADILTAEQMNTYLFAR